MGKHASKENGGVQIVVNGHLVISAKLFAYAHSYCMNTPAHTCSASHVLVVLHDIVNAHLGSNPHVLCSNGYTLACKRWPKRVTEM